jgi:hypothetical protein
MILNGNVYHVKSYQQFPTKLILLNYKKIKKISKKIKNKIFRKYVLMNEEINDVYILPYLYELEVAQRSKFDRYSLNF